MTNEEQILMALSLQSEAVRTMSSQFRELAAAVNRLCDLIAEDADPEDLPQLSLEGEEGGRPREGGRPLDEGEEGPSTGLPGALPGASEGDAERAGGGGGG